MPVTPEEWDAGKTRTQLASALLAFLREDSPTGYTTAELMDKMPAIERTYNFHSKNLTLSDMTEALTGLVADGELESKELGNGKSVDTYYRAAD